jgi:hypothetical protein
MEDAIGQSELNNGSQVEAGKNLGKVSVNSQAAIDKSAFTELNKEFKELSKHVTKFKADLPTLITDTKKWATELGKVAKQMKAIGAAKGGGGPGSSYLPAAGDATSVNSGNTTTVNKTIIVNEAGGGGGGGAPPQSPKAAAWDAIKNLAGSAINAMDARAARGASYSLSADKMNMLYQQTTGLSQNQVYHQYREPLQKSKLGPNGINTLLGLQASTGLNANKQQSSVEALRAASGYAYSTEDIAGMTKSLASAPTTNQMFMTLGTGMYGIGGKQRTTQQVYQDVIQRTGLTNEKVLKGAFQDGSNTRARLSMAGIADEQQDLILQMAQQNIAFNKKGGKGNYDQSNKEHRKLMGVEDNYANQAEESTRVNANREENFYKRQNDNFADFEKATQSVTKALQAFEEKLSGVLGAAISTKAHRSAASTAFSWGKKIVGAGMMVAGALGAAPTFGGSLALTAGGAAVMGAGGDPIDDVTRRGRGRGVWGVRRGKGTGGDATVEGEPTTVEGTTEPVGAPGVPESPLATPATAAPAAPAATAPAEPKLNPKDASILATLDQRLQGPLKKMMLANKRLHISDGRRSAARQEASFRKRYSKAPAGTTKKTKDSDRIWNKEVWIYDKHADGGPPMMPPGLSMHEIGLAADLNWSENEWVRANASKFGLQHGGTSPGKDTDEPFHVQPASLPQGRWEYENGQGVPASTPSGAATSPDSTVSSGATSTEISGKSTGSGGSSGGISSPATSSSSLSGPSTFKYAGMSIGEVIGVGSVYASSNIKPAEKPASSFAPGGTGGDPDFGRPVSVAPGQSQSSSNSYTITVSPSFNIHSSGSTPDLRKMAKEIASMLEQEVRMTMLRSS